MSKNTNLCRAKKVKNDEYYTRLADIEKELSYYDISNFQGKTVYCNCDDPRWSNFFKYFVENFHRLGLKKLISTCYEKQYSGELFENPEDFKPAVYCEYFGGEIEIKELKGDGDFRSKEVYSFFLEADIIVTNPPFSLFKDFVPFLLDHKKKFIVIGGLQGALYAEIFDRFLSGDFFVGATSKNKHTIEYEPKYEGWGKKCKLPSMWFTNIKHNNPIEPLQLTQEFNPIFFPTYDNFKAIEVSKNRDIPKDYDGMMGVPVTFLCHWNREQFEILGNSEPYSMRSDDGFKGPILHGKPTFKRIFIRRKDAQ